MKKRVVYVNGSFIDEDKAKVSVFDRGFLFADAVYEVTAVIDGKILEWDGHVKRLERSLKELDMKFHISETELFLEPNVFHFYFRHRKSESCKSSESVRGS